MPTMGVPESVPVRAYQCLDWGVSRSRLFSFWTAQRRNENLQITKTNYEIRTIVWTVLAGVLGCQVCLAQSISQSDLYNFIQSTWNVTSLSDSAIQQLLSQAPSDVTYNGIPYENLIGAMIESPRIIDDLNAGNYGAAGKVVLDYAQDQLLTLQWKN